MAVKSSYRVGVLFGEAGTGKRKRRRAIVLPLERVRNVTGLPKANEKDWQSDRKTKTGEPIALKGHRDNSIRVWLGGQTKGKRKKLIAVPYPAGATVRQIRAFVKKMKGARSFTMPSGRTYAI